MEILKILFLPSINVLNVFNEGKASHPSEESMIGISGLSATCPSPFIPPACVWECVCFFKAFVGYQGHTHGCPDVRTPALPPPLAPGAASRTPERKAVCDPVARPPRVHFHGIATKSVSVS